MALRTPTSGGDFELPPQGMHEGRCFKIVDLGTHLNPLFAKEVHKVAVYFELPKCLMTEGPNAGQPFTIKQDYTLSHHQKSQLRGMLEGWYGKRFDTKALDQAGGFDLEKILDRPGFINIVHSEDGKYANIASIAPLPKGFEIPPRHYELFLFSLEDFNPIAFSKLSPKMQDYIKQSGEYIKLHSQRPEPSGPKGGSNFDDLEDDIPF